MREADFLHATRRASIVENQGAVAARAAPNLKSPLSPVWTAQ
jgi:hypothetical protein